jgi:tetratricopeptide (TPR) repeat protein
VKEGQLAVWLQGAAKQLDDNLRGRLELLVSLRRGDLWLVAEEVLGAAKTTVQDFSSDDAEKWFDRGDNYYNAAMYEKALECFQQSVEINPEHYQAWQRLGDSLRNSGKEEESLVFYERSISINPEFHRVWSYRGISLANLGRYEEAIKSYDRAVSFKHNYHEAWYNRGVSLDSLGRYEEAIESYDRAISFKHDKHEAWYNRGISLGSLGRYEEEIENYQQGLSHLQPTTHPEGWGELHRALGRLQYRKGQNNFDKSRLDSRAHYRKALAFFQEAETTLTQFPELLKFCNQLDEVWVADE